MPYDLTHTSFSRPDTQTWSAQSQSDVVVASLQEACRPNTPASWYWHPCVVWPHLVAALVCVNKASGRRDGKMVHRYWNEVIKKAATSVRLALLHAWFPTPSLSGKQVALLWAAQGQGNDVSKPTGRDRSTSTWIILWENWSLQALSGALRWLRN